MEIFVGPKKLEISVQRLKIQSSSQNSVQQAEKFSPAFEISVQQIDFQSSKTILADFGPFWKMSIFQFCQKKVLRFCTFWNLYMCKSINLLQKRPLCAFCILGDLYMCKSINSLCLTLQKASFGGHFVRFFDHFERFFPLISQN